MAGRQSELFRYSGMTNPDITTGAKMFVSGLEMPEKIADDLRLKERQEAQDLRLVNQDIRQAKLYELNTPGSVAWLEAEKAKQGLKLDGMSKEQEWKMLNDPVYKNALDTAKRETPGSAEWYAAQKLIQGIKQDNMREEWKLKGQYDPATIAQMQALQIAKEDRAGQKAIAKDFFAIPQEKVTTTTVTPEDVAAVKNQLEGNATTRAGAKYNAIYENLVKPKTELDIDANGEVITYKANPTSTPEEAHAKALKESGLQDLLDTGTIKIDNTQLPKAGSTSKKVKYTPEEITQLKLDALKTGVETNKIPAALSLQVATALTPVKSAKDIREDTKVAIDMAEFTEKKNSDYWKHNAKGPDNGSGKAIRSALDDMFKTYGSPDLVGTGDRADMEEKLAKLQDKGYTDAQMTSVIEKSRGIYGDSMFGVNENGFLRAVEEGLGKLPIKK